MKTKIYESTLNGSLPKIPTELEEDVDRLMNRTKVEFKDINYASLEALAFRNDWEGYWDILEIFHNPLIRYKNDFVSLNPKKQGKFSQTFLFTLQGIEIYRDSCQVYEFPSISERLKGIRTKRSTINEYFCKYDCEFEKKISENDLVIPIFEKDVEYNKIMDFANKTRKDKSL